LNKTKANKRIRIGNQTAFMASNALAPFYYALANRFDAFEWFPDKKESGAGWDIEDLKKSTRLFIRRMAVDHDIVLAVHAPWWADLLQPAMHKHIDEDIAFARDIGATLLNVHLNAEKGIETYIQALLPLIRSTHAADLKLSIENTPLTSAIDFNRLFSLLVNLKDIPTDHVGICLDLGHANLSAPTRNNYIGFLDQLDANVPIIHIHLHENYGDRDSHLPIFTGPAGTNDAGILAFIDRLKKRGYTGSIILEQWPTPPSLLNQARDRLVRMICNYMVEEKMPAGAGKISLEENLRSQKKRSRSKQKKTLSAARSAAAKRIKKKKAAPNDGEADTDWIVGRVAELNRQGRSWREKLDGVYNLLRDKSFKTTKDHLIYLAIYLRFLGTGEIPCIEDGRHFRPNHHARTSQRIQEYLLPRITPDNAFAIRKILPWLPSYNSAYIRSEPLTRIRDIAHRNDIPKDLKQEIKLTLQNKLHRCAGPEDLATSESILQRITRTGTGHSPSFIDEFRVFHQELKEFFNAQSLEERLKRMIDEKNFAALDLGRQFLAAKQDSTDKLDHDLTTLRLLTRLRGRISKEISERSALETRNVRLVDIGLEDFAFVLSSKIVNGFQTIQEDVFWESTLLAMTLLVANLRLSGFAPEECSAIEADLHAWQRAAGPPDQEHLLLIKSTLSRCRRLTDEIVDRLLILFLKKAEQLGKALRVADQAISVYSEGEIRAHLVFQLSKLTSLLLKKIRRKGFLNPWEIIVPGTATGRLLIAGHLTELSNSADDEILALLARAEGDEDIPEKVKGIILDHELPHLSHLGVRCRQAGVVVVTCEDEKQLELLGQFRDKKFLLTVTADTVSFKPISKTLADYQAKKNRKPNRVKIPAIRLHPEHLIMDLGQVTFADGGGKADGLRLLAELAGNAEEGFKTPPSLVIPFGVMEKALHAGYGQQQRYAELIHRLDTSEGEGLLIALEQIHSLIESLAIDNEIACRIQKKFSVNEKLVIRSSANCEDLMELTGAGLYDSIVNISSSEVENGIRKVWASLWTKRAVLARKRAGIPQEKANMAVLVQQLIVPEYSFIMHTVNPVNRNADEIYLELAVGLGESIASASMKGTPYRLVCNKNTQAVQVLACASFSQAIWPDTISGSVLKNLKYSQISLSKDSVARNELIRRLARIGCLVEQAFGRPQDIEGVVTRKEIFLVQSRPQQGIF